MNRPSWTQVLRPGELARYGAGRDDDGVAVEHRAVFELDLAPLHVEPDGAAAQDLVHPQFARAPLVGQHRLLRRPRAGQHLLGQRGPVVGKVPLLADERDRPLEALPAQRLDGPPSGERGADDDDGAVRRGAVCRQAGRRCHWPNMAIHSCAERGRKT